MANWLAKFLAPPPAKARGPNLPVKAPNRPLAPRPLQPAAKMPNASVIYGIAASVLVVLAIYFFFSGLWFSGFLVLLPAACFLGFSLHFLKYHG